MAVQPVHPKSKKSDGYDLFWLDFKQKGWTRLDRLDGLAFVLPFQL